MKNLEKIMHALGSRPSELTSDNLFSMRFEKSNGLLDEYLFAGQSNLEMLKWEKGIQISVGTNTNNQMDFGLLYADLKEVVLLPDKFIEFKPKIRVGYLFLSIILCIVIDAFITQKPTLHLDIFSGVIIGILVSFCVPQKRKMCRIRYSENGEIKNMQVSYIGTKEEMNFIEEIQNEVGITE